MSSIFKKKSVLKLLNRTVYISSSDVAVLGYDVMLSKHVQVLVPHAGVLFYFLERISCLFGI
jgi:hypothetical protein